MLPSRTSFCGYLAVVLIASVFIAPFWVSVGGERLQVSNDFDCLYYRYKAYLLDVFTAELRIPLWSPSEAAGVPFYSNPFSATFYPLNLPLAMYRQAAHGYSIHDHQCFASLAIVILCVGLLAWIRSLGYPMLPAILAAAIAGTSLKVTELMRFPNAIHAAAWMAWLLYGINLTIQRRTRMRGMLVTATATVMVFTAGYPYFIYYLQFLLAPYICLALVPRTRGLLSPTAPPEERGWNWGGLLGLGIAFAGSLAVCLPYLLRMKLFLDQMQDRGGGDFAYSTAHEWNLLDTLGSLVYPPAAMAEGWYYFGMIGLLLALVYLAQTVFSTPRARREVLFVTILAIWFGAITYLTMGKDSTLFRLMWHVWPGFSRLRVWPRLNIVLVPLIAIFVARACSKLRLFSLEPDSAADANCSVLARWLVLAYLPLLAAQLVFWLSGYTSWYFEKFLASEPFQYFGNHWFLLSGFLAFLAILVVFVARQRGMIRNHAFAAGMLTALIGLNFLDTGALGVTQWSIVVDDADAQRPPLRIGQTMDLALTTPRTFASDTLPLSPAFNTGIVPNWYFDRYVNFLKKCGLVNSSGALLQSPRDNPALRLLGCVDGRRLHFTKTAEHQTAEEFLADADAAMRTGHVTIHVNRYDGDTLEAEIDTDTPGYLNFIDNWDPHWTAVVNDQKSPVLCVLGTFKAVRVERGKSRVRFEYRPFG